VRSNSKGRLGFIKNENRINVALSRARCGMYVIGNFKMIAKSEEEHNLWGKIINLAEKKQILGKELELKCWRHEETIKV
jgi:superfamily I DNA and/or RNA helicase